MPDDTTVVVFHSAVVAYLDAPARERFQALMSGLVAGADSARRIDVAVMVWALIMSQPPLR